MHITEMLHLKVKYDNNTRDFPLVE